MDEEEKGSSSTQVKKEMRKTDRGANVRFMSFEKAFVNHVKWYREQLENGNDYLEEDKKLLSSVDN